MDDFLILVSKIEEIEDFEKRKDRYIELFKNVKYSNPSNSLVVLFKLSSIYENKFEILYHIFNHFIMFGLCDESAKLINVMAQNKEQFYDIQLKNPLMIQSETSRKKIADAMFDGAIDSAINLLYEYSEHIDEETKSIRYFELAIKLRDVDVREISELYFKTGIKYAKKRNLSKFLLTYVQTLIKWERVDDGIKLLSEKANELDNDEALPLMYKLASIFEETDMEKALVIYQEIDTLNSDYLDVKEKISKLTKHENRYKINKLMENGSTDDSNIHF